MQPSFYRRAYRLSYTIIMLVLIAACTDPNALKGPTNVIGTGTGTGTGSTPGNNNLGFWSGVDMTQSRTLTNGITISSLAVSGGNIGRLFVPDTESILGFIQFHRLTQSPTAYQQSTTNNELGISCFIAESFQNRIPKAEVNVAEQTLSIKPSYFQDINANGITGINGLFAPLFPGKSVPQGRLTANVYFDSLRLSDNTIDIPQSITAVSPRDSTIVMRSSDLTIEFERPITFSPGTSVCEITIFSSFGIQGEQVRNIPEPLRKMAGSSISVTPDYKPNLIPRGVAMSGLVINRILTTGTQRVVIPTAELQQLPVGKCLVSITITTAKRSTAEHFILAASGTSEWTIILQ